MRVALIGASGFVGTRLIDLLSRDNAYSLVNIDLLPSPFFNDITVIGDVRDQNQMDKLLDGFDAVVLLAAIHRDDVTPSSLYYETNVEGMKITLNAMSKNGISHLIFFSSVAVYGLNKDNPDEKTRPDPFNHYGKSKWQAEQILQEWYSRHTNWNIDIIRPTVIFGERNRGNVYNLLHQISSGHFIMIGSGNNVKSMAYVGNVVSFVKFLLESVISGYNVFNYIDKPDLTMNELVPYVGRVLEKRIPTVHLPYWIGLLGGKFFDLLALLLHKKLAISSIRVKKFCATTQFDASKLKSSGFIAPYSLSEGLSRTLEFEFAHSRKDDIEFKSE